MLGKKAQTTSVLHATKSDVVNQKCSKWNMWKISTIFAPAYSTRNTPCLVNNFEMKKAFSVYIVSYLALLALMLMLLAIYPKPELHLTLNAYHTDICDTFFKLYSKLAEWPLYVLGLIPIFFKKYRLTLFYAICEVSGGLVVWILKRLFSAPRPISVFTELPDLTLPLVEGVKMHHSNSFPSGHTFTFFTFFTCCTLLLAYRLGQRNQIKWSLRYLWLLLPLLFAILGGYSRIYLSQHFLSDVCAGSVIGVIIPCLMYRFIGNKFF